MEKDNIVGQQHMLIGGLMNLKNREVVLEDGEHVFIKKGKEKLKQFYVKIDGKYAEVGTFNNEVIYLHEDNEDMHPYCLNELDSYEWFEQIIKPFHNYASKHGLDLTFDVEVIETVKYGNTNVELENMKFYMK